MKQYEKCPACEDTRYIKDIEQPYSLSFLQVIRELVCLSCNAIWRIVYKASEIIELEYNK